jgi:hypothetical protein
VIGLAIGCTEPLQKDGQKNIQKKQWASLRLPTACINQSKSLVAQTALEPFICQ